MNERPLQPRDGGLALGDGRPFFAIRRHGTGLELLDHLFPRFAVREHRSGREERLQIEVTLGRGRVMTTHAIPLDHRQHLLIKLRHAKRLRREDGTDR